MPKIMRTIYWQRLKDSGRLSEMRNDGFVVINCGCCATQWERERNAPRHVTIADRQSAIDHVLLTHGES